MGETIAFIKWLSTQKLALVGLISLSATAYFAFKNHQLDEASRDDEQEAQVGHIPYKPLQFPNQEMIQKSQEYFEFNNLRRS
jgi:uncharacterized membrane protein YebE (DUF533 family)